MSISLPRSVVVESLKTAGIPEEVLEDIPVRFRGGSDARTLYFDKDQVEWCLRQHRPPKDSGGSVRSGCLSPGGATSCDDDPLSRIANGIEVLIGILKPGESAKATPAIQVLTPDEASKRMRVNPQTVMKWCRQGKIGVKQGRRWLITPDEVERYLRGVQLTKGPRVAAR